MTLGAGVLFGLVRFNCRRRLRRPRRLADRRLLREHARVGLLGSGAVLAEGRFEPTRGTGGIPVETRIPV